MKITNIKLDQLYGKSLEDIFENHILELSEHLDGLFKKQFSISDSDIEHRTILHWEKENLIDKEITVGDGWRRYSFFDFVWLRVIKELRVFGTPISIIKKIRATLFESAATQMFSEISDDDIQNIKKKVEKAPFEKRNGFDDLTREKLFARATQEVLLTRFNIIVIQTIYTRTPTYLLLNTKGEIGVAMFNGISMKEKTEALFETIETNSTLLINVTNIIEEFFISEKFSGNTYFRLSPLSRQEKEIVEIIRSGGVNNINISLKNGGEFFVEILRRKPAVKVMDQIERIIAKNKYSRITLDTENGKVAYINEIEKRIIK